MWTQARRVSAESFTKRISRLKPRRGDVLFSREGTIGVAVTVTDDFDFCLGQRMMLFRFAPFVLPEFAEIFLLSGFFKQQYAPLVKGAAAKHLNIGDIRSLTILVPSIKIQRSIVDSINQLERHCDTLDELFSDAKANATSFVKAATFAITGISTQERTTMKIPNTELVSILNIGTVPTNLEQTILAKILVGNNGELPSKMLWNLSELDIDAFYQQLKLEMANGWIVQSEAAYIREEKAI